MSDINVRIVGTANMAAMTGPFAKLEAQVTALNSQLSRMVALQNGIDPKGYERMTRAAAQNSKTFRNAAASTGMFEVQQLRVNKATDDFISKVQKQKVSFGEMYRQQKLVNAAYQDQLKLQNAVARTSTTGITHGKMTVDMVTPNLVATEKATKAFGQRLAYTNALLKSGSTQMINWGKNTQWAGRQLSMGLTMPVVALGAAAGVMAYRVDQALTRVQKVYNTTAQSGMAQQKELDQVRQAGMKTAIEAAQQYGSAGTDTLNVQAELAAAGRKGTELQKDTIEVMRIARLGELDYNDAIKATISLQSVFNMNSKKLGETFNYINDVENQTSLQTEDFAKAIPIAAAPVKAFGGDIQQLGTLLVAMKQNGIQATQGANAIKAAMQRLGRPSAQVQTEWKALTNTDITKIFDKSKDLIDLFTRIGDATKDLAPKDQIKAFAGLFGTYQVTRMMAMVHGMEDLKNGVGQVSVAAKLASQDTTQWSKVAQQEIDRYQESISGKWDIAIQTMKLQLSTLGKPFVESATEIIHVISDIISALNKMPKPMKKILVFPVLAAAIAGPVLMLIGLMANLGGQGLKIISLFLPKMELFTTSQKAAALAAAQQEAAMTSELGTMELLTLQLNKLTAAQAAANKEQREARFNQLVQGGMSRTSAYAMVGSEYRSDMQSAGLLNAKGESIVLANNAEKAAESTVKMSKAARLIGPSVAIGAVGLAAMALSSDHTVQKFGEMLMYASLLGPALIPVGAKLAAGVKAAFVASKGLGVGMTAARAGAAGFAAEMSIASLATVGIAAAVVAIGAAWYFANKHVKEMEARQQAILDAQIKANKTLVDTSAHFAANLGKAAGSYDSIIHGNQPRGGRDITGTPATSMTYKAYQYYKNDDTGKKEAAGLKTALSDTDTMMAKLKQQYLDLQQVGHLTAKQAMDTIQGELIAIGKSGNDALSIANQVRMEFGSLKNINWGSAIGNSLRVARAELAKTAGAAGYGHNATYTPYYSVDYKKETEDFKKGLAGIKPQLMEMAGVFNTAFNSAVNPKQAKSAIDQLFQAAISEFNTQFQSMMKNPYLAAFLQGKNITSGAGLAKAFDAGQVSYGDLEGIISKHHLAAGDQGYFDPQQIKASLEQAKLLENAIIGSVSGSNSLADSIKTGAGFLAAMAKNANQMTFKQAKSNAVDMYQSVQKAQEALAAAKLENIDGTNKVGVGQAKSALAAAESQAQMNLSAIATAKNIKVGADASETLFNIMNNVKDKTDGVASGAKNAADALNRIPRRIDITLSGKEAIQVVHDAMSATEDDMVTSAQNTFNSRWDATMQAEQSMWDKRSQALQNRQSNAQQALQNRQQDAQDAMDKRFQKAEDDINKRYQKRIDNINKEIKAEQDADAKRQAMYEAEKKRLEDLANMANQNIDFNVAINEGNFDEAAKIRNDAQSASDQSALDAREAAASARVQKTVDKLQKKIDQLEKSRDKELKNLKKLEDVQKKHLERMQQQQSNAQQRAQQAEQDALKKREDADMASQQKTRDYEEAMLNQRLDLFKTYIAKNQKDLERWMHKVGLTYSDFGSDIKAKGESWASYFQKALHDHIIAGASQITSDDMWNKITPKLANKLLKGLGFANLAAFRKFVNKGILTEQQRNGNTGTHGPGGHSTQHGGGMVGSLFGQNNRKGLRATPGYGGLNRTETMVRAQKGEFLVNKKAATENRPLLEHINGVGGKKYVGYGGATPVGAITGYPIAMMAAGFEQGTETSSRKVMKAYQHAAITHSGTSAGFKPGKGGTHRPVPKGIGLVRGIHDQYTGFPAVDIAAPLNTPAYAVANGTITVSKAITSGGSPGNGMYSTPYTSYGNVIYLKTDGGPTVLYAHLNKRMVSAGKRVLGGSRIGLTGNTGNSTGPHLHFGDSDGNPYEFLRKGGEVKFDNTHAILHKGETVLTDKLTQKFKDNVASGGSTVYDIDVAVSGSDLDPNDVADAVIDKLEKRKSREPRSRRNRD